LSFNRNRPSSLTVARPKDAIQQSITVELKTFHFIYNFIHHKVANNSRKIQQWKMTTEKQTKY